MFNYEEMLKEIREASKDDIKMANFEINQELYDRIKKLDIDKDTRKAIVLLVKDSEFLTNLLINALK